jgi:hypothetical protein
VAVQLLEPWRRRVEAVALGGEREAIRAQTPSRYTRVVFGVTLSRLGKGHQEGGEG